MSTRLIGLQAASFLFLFLERKICHSPFDCRQTVNIMGQYVSSIIDGVEDNEQKEKLANDTLNMMLELGNQQIELFKSMVTYVSCILLTCESS